LRREILGAKKRDRRDLLNFARRFRYIGGFLLSLHFFRFRSLFLEAINAAFGIDELLPAREEGVAARTNFNAQIAFMRGTGSEGRSARADYLHIVVGGVNPGFHCFRILSVG
jgi:hypothetical protein